MAIAGALQVNTMLEELDLAETDQVMYYVPSAVVILKAEWTTKEQGLQGPGTRQIDWLWEWFCSPGVTIWRKVFLIKKFSSNCFAHLWKPVASLFKAFNLGAKWK